MTSVVLRNGTAFSIEGAQSPGGALTISDPSSGKAILAANSGDYVYPSDVRFNAETSRLYVKTQGLAGGIWPTTDLFEYDLSERRLLQRARTQATRNSLSNVRRLSGSRMVLSKSHFQSTARLSDH